MIPQALDIEIKSVGDQETESLKEINLSFAFYFLPAFKLLREETF